MYLCGPLENLKKSFVTDNTVTFFIVVSVHILHPTTTRTVPSSAFLSARFLKLLSLSQGNVWTNAVHSWRELEAWRVRKHWSSSHQCLFSGLMSLSLLSSGRSFSFPFPSTHWIKRLGICFLLGIMLSNGPTTGSKRDKVSLFLGGNKKLNNYKGLTC